MDNIDFSSCVPSWAESLGCAITVCDADCNIIFMNERSRATFAGGSRDLMGRNLLECHSPRSVEIIRRLLAEGGTNCYTIEKGPVRKMIYQTAWHAADGSVGGLVELSMVIPAEMPHYVRS